MTKTSLKDAFEKNGLRAEYDGNPAKILPVTQSLVDDLDLVNVRQSVEPGQILVSWNDGEKRKGGVLDGDEPNSLAILLKRNDGSELRIDASNYRNAAIGIINAHTSAREDEAAVAKFNEQAERDHAKAVQRGENPAEFEPRKTEFPEGAFDKVLAFLPFSLAIAIKEREEKFTDIKEKGRIDAFVKKVVEYERNQVSRADKMKIDEMRQVRAEIGFLSPEHADAIKGKLPKTYEGDGKAARELAMSLPEDPGSISEIQKESMSIGRGMGPDVMVRLFSVATTTPVHQIVAKPLSHDGFKAIGANLKKYENSEHGPAVLSRMSAVTRDSMKTYDWEGKLYTKDGADVLLMRDEFISAVYVWDAASRVNEVNVEAALIGSYSQADVPSDDELQRLRDALADLRYDNGAEVDFSWDEDPAEDDAPLIE